MLPFLDLPPEIRLIIYKILLQYALAKDIRILYSGNNPLRCRDYPHSIRHKQPFEHVAQDHIWFSDAKNLSAHETRIAQYNIHHADIDDLLFLASSCRLLRSELLALAWSNADIRIESPEAYKELRCVFYDRLTSETCNFIRTLHFNVDEDTWAPSESREIVELIIHRLPRLEQLIVNIVLRSRDGLFIKPLTSSAAALDNLPLHVAIELRHHIYRRLRPSRILPALAHLVAVRDKDESATAQLQSLRTQISLIRQKRREEQLKKKQEDQVGDTLDATVEMRSLMAG
ncbi:hypothetical protein KCU85_g4740, partial [Aureobasidium melanogenum]